MAISQVIKCKQRVTEEDGGEEKELLLVGGGD